MTEYLTVFLSGLVIANVILTKGLGLTPMMRKQYTSKDVLLILSLSSLIMVLAAIASYILHVYVLYPHSSEYLSLFAVVLLVLVFSWISQKILVLVFKKQADQIARQSALFAVNGAFIYNLVSSAQQSLNLLNTCLSAVATALGFTLFLMIISKIDERNQIADAPSPFKGTSLFLVSIGLLVIAFSGLAGIV